MENIPQINKTYNCFDDGKIRESRRYEVTVKKVIPFKDISKKVLKMWEKESKTCDWLYAPTTDFFIKTHNQDKETEIFVRTKNNGWFSLGALNSGRLDIDGSLTQMCEL